MGSEGSRLTLQIVSLGRNKLQARLGDASHPREKHSLHCITCLHWLRYIIVVVKAAELSVVPATF